MTLSQDATFYAISDRGKIRRNNQDAYKVCSKQKIGVLADGVGGLNHGEVASKTVVESCLNYIKENIDNESQLSDSLIRNELNNAIKIANEHLITIQSNDQRYSKMGTTVVCFAIIGGVAYYSWVGDSRLYLYCQESKSLIQLTNDHTLDPDKLDCDSNPRLQRQASGVLTRMMGATLYLKPDHGETPFKPGDILLACSDGLTDLVRDEFIQQQISTIENQSSLEACAKRLVDKALDVGGKDNITIILAQSLNG